VVGLADRFRKALAGVIAMPWMLATGEDFRYPQTTGVRPPAASLLNRYVARLHGVTGYDTKVLVSFLWVMNMLKHPFSLFAPAMVWRVLTSRPAPAAQPAARPAAQKSLGGT
jgi:hypothetical protein